MPVPYRYRTVDVFTDQPLQGNPLAVFPDGRGLGDATMQQIARELNLSETVFVLPARDPACVARARIFTPSAELAFAGHPTLGTAFVVCDEGMVAAPAERFAFGEGVGAVAVRIDRSDGFMAWLTTPPISFGATYDRAACARAVRLSADDLCPDVPAQVVTAGAPGVFIAVRDPAAVDRAALDLAALRCAVDDPSILETFVFAPTPQGAYARMFAPELGIPEDPATGGLTGPLAAFMMKYGLAAHADGTRLISEQGVKLGRRSVVHIAIHGEHGTRGIEIGGAVAPLAEGAMSVPTPDRRLR